jgi:hypothetical protein
MPGVVALAWLVVPSLGSVQAKSVPAWVAGSASTIQGGVLLAIAVWAGCRLAPAVGLRAPLFLALAQAHRPAAAMHGRVLPGLIGGAAGALVLIVSATYVPDALGRVQEALVVPLPVRVLYGGITEELLMRWGCMSFLVWLFWRLAPSRQRAPGVAVVWSAIVASAILFGLGHLPVVNASVADLTLVVAAYVVTANAIFGVLAGWLFWRWGLETAMVAHVAAHLIAAGFAAIGD